MKQVFFGICLFTGIFATTSCNHAPGEGNPQQTLYEVLYSADSAKEDMAYFDTLCTRFISDSADTAGVTYSTIPIKGFTVRAVDLLAAMGLPASEVPELPYKHIRVYLGFNKAIKNFKMFIVPVHDAELSGEQPSSGVDVLLNDGGGGIITGNQSHYPPGYLNGKFVLDLNAPCPNLCDVNTPLMNNNQ